MSQKLALLHTSPTLTPMFTELAKRWLPDVSLFHMVDESLIKETIRAGRLERLTMRRVIAMVESAEQAGATAVLVTCSSIGEATSVAQMLFDIPVVRIDEAMATEAVTSGARIGVLATLRTTLEPTTALLNRKAAELKRTVEIVEVLCDGAFEAVMAGDTLTHDRLLTDALTSSLNDVDVIVLAQASMARVVASLPAGAISASVLSSPELAIKTVARRLGVLKELEAVS